MDKMLQNPDPKSTPMVDAMLETFAMTDVSSAIPRFIWKALHILRREANEIRKDNNIDLLDDYPEHLS